MPQPKTLADARDEVLNATIHAAAQLVLHICGRMPQLSRRERDDLIKQLEYLVSVAKKEG